MAIGRLNKFSHIHELLNLGLCLYHFLVCKIFNAISISIFDCVCLNPCSMSNYPKIDKKVVCLFKICTDSLTIIILLKVPENTGTRLKRCFSQRLRDEFQVLFLLDLQFSTSNPLWLIIQVWKQSQVKSLYPT